MPIRSRLLILPNPAGDSNTVKANHEYLRDDRPSHGWVGRAIGIYLRVSVRKCHGKPEDRVSASSLLSKNEVKSKRQ